MAEPDAITRSGWDRRSFKSFLRYLEAVADGGSKSRLLRREGVVASVAPATPYRSLFNSVAYEHPVALQKVIDELRDAYARAGVRAWTVWVPESDRGTAKMLNDRGHRYDGFPRLMACDLESIPDPDDLLDFARDADWGSLCEINDAAHSLDQGTFEAGLGGKPDSGFRAYGARHAGFDASALATLICEGDCGVHAVATLPEARGHRLAGGLLQRALIDAREHGAVTSTLQSNSIGAAAYVRLGYRDLGGLELWEHRVFPD